MKIFNKYIIYVSMGALFLSSCDKKFEKLNTNPNAPEKVSPDMLLPYATKLAGDMYWGRGNESLGVDVGNQFAQHWARIQYTETDRYIIPQGVINAWSDFYTAVNSFEDVQQLGKEMNNPNYTAIGKIGKSWIISLITDIYGDVPYSEAAQGKQNILSPKYDAQKDVYKGLIEDLKAANELLSGTGTVNGDILLNGNMLKWKKFSNSLSLRLLNRLVGKADAGFDVQARIAEIISDPAKYPLISSKDDNIQLNYLGAIPNVNPIYQTQISRDDHRISETIVNYLVATNDQRLEVYADKSKDGGVYKGIPNGLLANDAYALGLDKTSKPGIQFRSATSPAVIISYAELLFVKSELAFKGVNVGDTYENLYEQAIKASFAQYGLTASTTYLNGVKIDASNPLKSIMTQKWVALFGQGIEAWTEQRRTNIPNLVAPVTNVNNNVIPTRLPYPATEESLNVNNFKAALANQNGKNDMQFKLWWAK